MIGIAFCFFVSDIAERLANARSTLIEMQCYPTNISQEPESSFLLACACKLHTTYASTQCRFINQPIVWD